MVDAMTTIREMAKQINDDWELWGYTDDLPKKVELARAYLELTERPPSDERIEAAAKRICNALKVERWETMSDGQKAYLKRMATAALSEEDPA